MAIDDPLDALEKQFENEVRSTDPVAERLIHLASALPLPWQVDKIVPKIIGYQSADRLEKIELTINAIREELRRHEDLLREMAANNEEEAEKIFQEWLPLVKDGIEKAQRTRANSRIARIATILARSLVSARPPESDDVEEMMRTAMDLSDHEVELLTELVRIEGTMLNTNGQVHRYQAWEAWPNGHWGSLIDGDIESAFSKLESFGLVSRVAPPNTVNIMGDLQSRYGLLRKGVKFIEFVRRRL